ncbi:MAG: D-alanyl-D-alanine carboxypeptidase [Solirubrobacteraceae bacterium]|nr:D-alanyl-D-alanine carboxypeptidase [Solirubrobacteraceae bacterium]
MTKARPLGRAGIVLLALIAGLLAIPVAPSRAADGPPSLTARSAIVIEASTGDVAYAKRAGERRQIASTTKMMTALVSRSSLSLGQTLRAAPYAALPVESKIDLRTGEPMRVSDLLRALMIASANDAAVTLAVGSAGSRSAFVKDMNARADALGLENTHFANPVGLDDARNYSTASDLVKLAVAVREDAFLRRIISLPRATLETGARQRTIINRNGLVRAGFANGVKTGHTNRAGYLLVGSKTRDGITVVSAVMGEPSEAARDADSRALLTWALNRYSRDRVLDRGRVVATVPIRYRDTQVGVIPTREISRVVPAGEGLEVAIRGVPGEVDGPLPAGSPAGTAVVTQGGRELARVQLVTAEAVPEAGVWLKFQDFMDGKWWLVGLTGLLLLGTLCTLVLRRRAAQRRHLEAERRRASRDRARAALEEQSPVA